MAARRTLVSIGWSLQRAHHGEQPFWALVTLAAMLGRIGLPGGGFVRLQALEHDGQRSCASSARPAAGYQRLTIHSGGTHRRCCCIPAGFIYNGGEHRYPDIRLSIGRAATVHHHQDLNRLRLAWRKPGTLIFHEQFWTAAAKTADIVLPTTCPGARRHHCARVNPI
jgi:biotin/methionine sulfoxide reductase